MRHAPRPGLRGSLALVLAWTLAGNGALRLWAWWSAGTAPALARHAAVAAAVTAALALVWKARLWLYRTLTSVPFSIACLGALLVATVLGTVVVQNAEPAELAHRYGPLAPLLRGLGIDDLFHAPWFRGLTALLAVSVLLTGTRRAVWRLPMAGHVLCHLGVFVVLAGGLVGNLFGHRGVLELREGQTVTEMWETRRGVPTGRRLPLGFALRLERFEIERYDPEYRLYLARVDGDDLRRELSFGLDEAADWTRLSPDVDFRVLATFPDYHLRAELREAPGRGGPALEVFEPERPGGPEPAVRRLLAGVPGRDALRVDAAGLVLRLVAEAPRGDALEALASVAPEGHLLSWRTDAGERREAFLAPGEELALEGTARTARLLEYLPDFVYDVETRSARSRSETPRNPAVRVVLLAPGLPDEELWLFQNMPGHGSHGTAADALELNYRHENPSRPAERELLVVADDEQLWELASGVPLRTHRLDELDELPGWPGSRFRLLAEAIETHEPATRSDEWRHPAVELELRSRGDGEAGRAVLDVGGRSALWLPDGETLLSLERKPNDVRAYRSHVSVLEDGVPVHEATIAVNEPLARGGLHLYQTSYREEDPGWSGMQVVRDPGFPVVLVGFLMLGLGVIFVYYVRPRLLHHHGGTR